MGFGGGAGCPGILWRAAAEEREEGEEGEECEEEREQARRTTARLGVRRTPTARIRGRSSRVVLSLLPRGQTNGVIPRRERPAFGYDRRTMFHARSLQAVLFLSLALGLVGSPGTARAKSHLWKFKEIFSNADGTIQSIEMEVIDPAGTSEWVTVGQHRTSTHQDSVIPIDPPNENSYQRSMLFATPAFAALPGAPAPDFVLPAGFFDPAGDELRDRSVLDVLVFATGELPTDGRLALRRSDRTTPTNSPENFAGVEATIDASGAAAVGGLRPRLLLPVLILALALHAHWRPAPRPA